MKRTLLILSLALLHVSCGGTDGRSGLSEPLLVHGAQFVEGDLPGLPRDTEQDVSGLPTVTSATSEVAALRERLAGVSFFGLASSDATAVGVRIQGEGDGYYRFPTGAIDAQDPDVLTWSFVADFQASLEAGRYELLTVAFDEKGKPGRQASTSICIRSLRPDNGNSCFPAIAPPALVVSLEWDTPVDLDLILVTPSGQILDPKKPSTAVRDEAGELDPTASGVGNLLYDGNADCHFDGRMREDVVFQDFPPSGRYLVYANLFRHCDQNSVNYVASRHIRSTAGDEEYGVSSRDIGAGTLIARQANGGAKIGTFVGEFTIE